MIERELKIEAPAKVQTLWLAIPATQAREFPRLVRMQRDIEERLAAVPGVESVGYSNRIPLQRTGPNGPFSFEDAPEAQPTSIEFRYVSPGFLPTLGTPLAIACECSKANWLMSRRSRGTYVRRTHPAPPPSA